MPEISIIPRELKKLTFSPNTWDSHPTKFDMKHLNLMFWKNY